jgi:hypothetical protein
MGYFSLSLFTTVAVIIAYSLLISTASAKIDQQRSDAAGGQSSNEFQKRSKYNRYLSKIELKYILFF